MSRRKTPNNLSYIQSEAVYRWEKNWRLWQNIVSLLIKKKNLGEFNIVRVSNPQGNGMPKILGWDSFIALLPSINKPFQLTFLLPTKF